MCKVIDCFHIRKYAILVLEKFPLNAMHYLKVKGQVFKFDIAYDIPNSICIESEENFAGEIIEFIPNPS